MEKLVLLDSNSILNKAYYSMPKNMVTHSGQFTGAITGYLNMFFSVIEKYKPTHVVAVFDRKAPTFRKAMYSEYKAQRKGMPDDLASQIEPLKEIIRSMNVKILELDGYEADDIIGTVAKKYKTQTYILTGDRDSFQLIDDTTTVIYSISGVKQIIEYTPERLLEDGFVPSQIIDYKSLMGDASDNIPGVPGVGEVTAKKLLKSYSTLDGVYDHIDEIKGTLKNKLVDNKELAYLSYKLATIFLEVPIELNYDEFKFELPLPSEAREKFKEYELNKLVDRLDFDVKAEPIKKIEVNNTQVETKKELEELVEKINKNKQFSLYMAENIQIALSSCEVYTINIATDFFGELTMDLFVSAIKPILEDKEIKKYFYDLKSYMHEFAKYNIEISKPYDDVLLKAYLVDSNKNYKSIKELKNSYNTEVDYNAAALFVIDEIVEKELKDMDLESLYLDLELPLVDVLFRMEQEGFKIDKNKLVDYSSEFAKELDDLVGKIYELAGEKFNVNSPKQLGTILFEKLGLKTNKKTKTGYSTNVEVLQELESEHDIVKYILRYREVSKLKSTYLDGMLPLIDRNDKLHTDFKQTVTSTGRLSSTDPNLQNIPVRKPEGKLIRALFIASEGRKLVCADYSQIELRLMADFSKDESMINAFRSNEDIHSITASKVLSIPLDEVTPELRRHAKAVNFGIIYGISDYGLSRDLQIPVYKAKEFIQGYFATYPRVKEYMKDLVDMAKKNGYAETILKRRRSIPELSASNYNIKSFGERIAMNMPLQGSASDIIKLAMIKVDKRLKDENLKSKLIMQVHDELIIDAYEDEVEKVKVLLKEEMENVFKLSVPLIVEVGVGENWLESK